MEVAYWQHFGLPFGNPAVASRRLTLRAMAIAARVIRDGLMPALGALVDMSAQGSGAAARDGVQHFDVRPVQPAPALFDEAGAASANDVSHLDGGRFISWLASPCRVRWTKTRPVVHRAVGDFAEMLTGQVQIDDRVADVGVAEQFLNARQIGAGFQQVRGVAVAQRMRVNALGDAGALCRYIASVPDDFVGNGASTRCPSTTPGIRT